MPYILSVDYDGTLFEGKYPDLGLPKWDIINHVKKFKENGAETILFTCREGRTLEEAVRRCKEIGLEFDSVNDNSPSNIIFMRIHSIYDDFCKRKPYADFYLDDKSYNLEIFLKLDPEKECQKYRDRR